MKTTDIIDDVLDTIIDFKRSKSKKIWHETIIENLQAIHKRNPNNEVFYSLININNKEYLIYSVVYNEMFIDIKIYTPELKDCFLLKLNCRINRTLLSINELIVEDLDRVSKLIPTDVFKFIIEELENYAKKNRILAINIYYRNFVPPFNKEIEKICSKLNFRQINTNIGISLYKDIKN